MRIESVQLSGGQPLTEAYVNRTDPATERLFGGHSADDEAWLRRLRWVEESSELRAPAARLAEVLERYNRRFNDHPAVACHIRDIAEGAPVVVGGQQAGLWTGPLLVIHKAVTVLTAAREATELTGRKVVPVFWIAGEDHDWDEANHAYVHDGDNGMRKIALERPAGPRTSVSRTRIEREAMSEAMESLASSLPDSAFKPELIGKLAQFANDSQTLSEWFAYAMGWLFGERGLVLLDSDDPQLRKLEAPMFRRMLEKNDELGEAYRIGADEVSALGYSPQAEVAPDGANLFLFQESEPAGRAPYDGERTLLYKRNGRFVNRRNTQSWSREELLAIADSAPERLSNNVLTRPIMQDYVLPVLATVLGPGEIAYWALTARAFAALGMRMPVIAPRMAFTLVEDAVAKHMIKYELTLDDVARRFAELKESWLKERDEIDIDGRFAEAKRQFAELYDPLLKAVESVEAGLSALGDKNKSKIFAQIDYMQIRTKEAHARKYEAVTRQLDRIAVHLHPEGQPQERVVNVAVYWNSCGPAVLDALLAVPYDRCGGHRMIYI